jgi:hypothetical protein
LECGIETLNVAHLKQAFPVRREFHKFPRVYHIRGQRFFNQYWNSDFQERARNLPMCHRGDNDRDSINHITIQEFTIVRQPLRLTLRRHTLPLLGATVRNGHKINVR